MGKKLLTPQDGFRAIAQMTLDTRRFVRVKLAKIMDEVME